MSPGYRHRLRDAEITVCLLRLPPRPELMPTGPGPALPPRSSPRRRDRRRFRSPDRAPGPKMSQAAPSRAAAGRGGTSAADARLCAAARATAFPGCAVSVSPYSNAGEDRNHTRLPCRRGRRPGGETDDRSLIEIVGLGEVLWDLLPAGKQLCGGPVQLHLPLPPPRPARHGQPRRRRRAWPRDPRCMRQLGLADTYLQDRFAPRDSARSRSVVDAAASRRLRHA